MVIARSEATKPAFWIPLEWRILGSGTISLFAPDSEVEIASPQKARLAMTWWLAFSTAC